MPFIEALLALCAARAIVPAQILLVFAGVANRFKYTQQRGMQEAVFFKQLLDSLAH
jgi:hypothetical protein